eukprot:CAMPEP_0170091574 /NCGR_PEP_ID=MMETSP0019_2-20121128/25151_1 /TAXON_ID=98059 /ORGANISM="Dinobryon sp., Strain UTEXLB2267" /LENGTH=632 /DNA_ID=CAMNT_0010311559 /DNA_START=72 /DNA_END=1967 /DNA_ORIENTATION=-
MTEKCKEIKTRHGEFLSVVAIGIILRCGYKTFYSNSNTLTYLLELTIADVSSYIEDGMDESLSPNTALYQIWGQSARDKYRYSIRPGSVLLIKHFSACCLQPRTDIDRKYRNNTLLVLKDGDFLIIDEMTLVEEIQVDSILLQAANSKISRACLYLLRQSSQQIRSNQFLSLVRNNAELILKVDNLSDISKSRDVFLFNVKLKTSVEAYLTIKSQIKESFGILQCEDSEGKAVKIRIHSDKLPNSVPFISAALLNTNHMDIEFSALRVVGCYHDVIQVMETTSTSKVRPNIISTPVRESANNNADTTKNLEADETLQASNRNDWFNSLELTNWEELKKMFAAMDLNSLQSQFGKRKVLKCSLKRVAFEGNLLNNLHRNLSIHRVPVNDFSEIDSISKAVHNTSIKYKDAIFTLTAPHDPDLSKLFNAITNHNLNADTDTTSDHKSQTPPPKNIHMKQSISRIQEMVSQLLNSATQEDLTLKSTSIKRTPSYSHYSALPLSMQLPLLSFLGEESQNIHHNAVSGTGDHRYQTISNSDENMEIRAVVHHDALQQIFCGLPAELVAASIWKHRQSSSSLSSSSLVTGCKGFDYRDSYFQLLQSLERSCHSQSEDFLLIIRICPMVDSNGMIAADV